MYPRNKKEVTEVQAPRGRMIETKGHKQHGYNAQELHDKQTVKNCRFGHNVLALISSAADAMICQRYQQYNRAAQADS